MSHKPIAHLNYCETYWICDRCDCCAEQFLDDLIYHLKVEHKIYNVKMNLQNYTIKEV